MPRAEVVEGAGLYFFFPADHPPDFSEQRAALRGSPPCGGKNEKKRKKEALATHEVAQFPLFFPAPRSGRFFGLRLTGLNALGEASFLAILGITSRSVNRPNCAVS